MNDDVRDLPLFAPTPATARASRDAALASVADHADPGWLEHALGCLERTARELAEFISDDVWDRGLRAPREGRALGVAFRRAARSGLIQKSDRLRPSVRSYLSGKPVWRSLVYRGAGC